MLIHYLKYVTFFTEVYAVKCHYHIFKTSIVLRILALDMTHIVEFSHQGNMLYIYTETIPVLLSYIKHGI